MRDPDARLDCLLTQSGQASVKSSDDEKQQIPIDLAEEYFELQEFMLEDPEHASEKLSAFSGKITHLALGLDHEIFTLASKINWGARLNPAAASGDISKILDLCKRRSYLLSLIENAKKLNRASGAL